MNNKEQEKEECPHWKCNGCRKCGGWAENPDIEKSCYFDDCECHSKCNCQEICDGECSIVEPYGFVPNTGCPRHDMPFINKEQEKEEKCDSGNIVYTSHPAQYKCIKCGKFWFEYEQTPICSTRNVLPPEEKLSSLTEEFINLNITCSKDLDDKLTRKLIADWWLEKLSSHNARLIERVCKTCREELKLDHEHS